MIGTPFARRLAIMSRQKAIASAVVYGLSLSVRFTSAAGEEVEIAAQSIQQNGSAMSIMAGSGTPLPYRGFIPHIPQPIALRQGWPPSASTSRAMDCVAP